MLIQFAIVYNKVVLLCIKITSNVSGAKFEVISYKLISRASNKYIISLKFDQLQNLYKNIFKKNKKTLVFD